MRKEELDRLEEIMKNHCFNPPIYSISTEGNELVSETKHDDSIITLKLNPDVHVNLNGQQFYPEEGDYLCISFEEEDNDNIKLGIVNGMEEDGLYFERGRDYAVLDMDDDGCETLNISFKSLPMIIQDKGYIPGIMALFPFIQRSTRYSNTEHGLDIITDIYGFLTPDDLNMVRLDTVIDNIASTTDINNHFSRVNYKEAYYRSLPTLYMKPGSVIVEASNEGDRIFLIDKIEESINKYRPAYVLGNSLDPITGEMNMAIIQLSLMIEDMSRFNIIDDEPIFSMSEDGDVKVLISPFEEDDVSNDVLVSIAEYLEEIYIINKNCTSIDSKKLNELVNKVKNGGRIDRKRNKLLKTLKEVYGQYKDYITNGRLDAFYDRLVTKDPYYRLYLYHEDTKRMVKFDPADIAKIISNLEELVLLFGLE